MFKMIVYMKDGTEKVMRTYDRFDNAIIESKKIAVYYRIEKDGRVLEDHPNYYA